MLFFFIPDNNYHIGYKETFNNYYWQLGIFTDITYINIIDNTSIDSITDRKSVTHFLSTKTGLINQLCGELLSLMV